MIVLDATNASLVAVIDAGGAANDIHYIGVWADNDGTPALTVGQYESRSNGTTGVTVLGSPAASTQRMVRRLRAYNGGAGSHTITLSYVRGATTSEVGTYTLAAGANIDLLNFPSVKALANVGNGYYLSRMSSSPVYVTGAVTATPDCFHAVRATSSFTITMPASPSTGTIIAFGTYCTPGTYHTEVLLDAGAGVSICGRTRYLSLTNDCALILLWDGAQWIPLTQHLEGGFSFGSGQTTIPSITGTVSNPSLGTHSEGVSFIKRTENWLEYTWECNATAAGSAGSGTYLFGIAPNFTIDTNYLAVNTSAEPGSACGVASCNNTTTIANSGIGIPMLYSSSQYRLYMTDAGGTTGFVGSATSRSFAASRMQLNIALRLPIVNW